MPPLPLLRTPVMNALERRTRSADRAVLVSLLERAEALCGEIDPEGTYPDEWLYFRLCGERLEFTGSALGEVATTAGHAALADLPALVERVCVAAGLTETELVEEGGLRAEDLAARWTMSRKTLDRLRRQGLLARRGASSKSKHVLVFMPRTIEAFEKRNSARLASAGKYSRLSNEEQRALIAEYEALRQEHAVSITAAARVLAAKHGRSVEGVRLFLKRETRRPRGGGSGDQDDHGPINARVRRVLLRASGSALDLSRLAERFGRTRPAVRRAVVLARAESLVRLRDAGHLIAPVSPAFVQAGAGDTVLGTPLVRQGLGLRGETDLLDLVTSSRHSPPPTGAEERARLVAYQFIRCEAAREMDALDRLHPRAPSVDHLETLLRWAARLKAEVIRPHLRLIVQTIEGRVGRRAEEIRSTDLTALFRLSIGHAGHAVDVLEGTRGGRVAGPVGLAVDKGVVEWLRRTPSVDANPRRASALLAFGSIVPDWTLRVSPWQRWLEPDPRLRAAAEGGTLAPDKASFLAARFGWAGGPPMTLDELASQRGLTHIRAAMFEHVCLVEAMDIARGKGKASGALPARKRA